MKIGIIGGTGEIGEGMAMRLSRIVDVMVGSRDETKANETCRCCMQSAEEKGLDCCIDGGTNQAVMDATDTVILAIPFGHLRSTVCGLSGFEDKLVISPVNPMEKRDCFMYTPPLEGSAALFLKDILPESARICTAFNNISGKKWRSIDEELDYSVPVCGDEPEAKKRVMDLVNQISLLKAYDAGPLSISPLIEGITPLLLNIARFNRMKDVGVRFV